MTEFKEKSQTGYSHSKSTAFILLCLIVFHENLDVKKVTCPFNLIHHCIQILYRQNRQSKTHILETNNTSAELLVPFEEDYLIEIRTVSDGGDGSSSEEIRIPKMSSKLNHHRCCRF